MHNRTYVGFGFGAIQSGLFLYEAHASGAFSRLVVAEVMPEVVRAVREGGGTYALNIATPEGIRAVCVDGIEILNPADGRDRELLVQAVAEAAEIGTALPSVDFFRTGRSSDVAAILADGLRAKRSSHGPRCVIYTAENHNHAAEILDAHLVEMAGEDVHAVVQCLNTVVGKMSGIVTDPERIRAEALQPVTPGSDRAFLVEVFNRILVSRIAWGDFERGIRVFEEKSDLLPFEEAKLYGHNAVHALIGYLLMQRGAVYMGDAVQHPDILAMARAAFIDESGAALCRKHAGVDGLFTPGGYRAYAEDLLDRMVNPYLRDQVARITRDPRRKLGWDDRLIGTMRVVLSQGLKPDHFARGARAALALLAAEEGVPADDVLAGLWKNVTSVSERDAVVRMLKEA